MFVSMCQLQMTYLRGVLGLPMIRRGERIFGSNENLSLMFSRTDGATYVNPYENKDERQNRGTVGARTQMGGRSWEEQGRGRND